MANGNATIIVGSARMGRSIVPFFQCVKSYFIQFITNQLPETGRIVRFAIPYTNLLKTCDTQLAEPFERHRSNQNRNTN